MAHWHNYPMNSVVRWPRDEKIIGVLGVAPLATADFFYKLCSIKTQKDWQHPRILIDSNPKIPSRGRYLELGETNPVPFIRKGIADLAAQGADIVAVPCNTAHILYSQYADDSPVILPNIIEITVRSCVDAQSKKAFIMGSQLTVQHRLYQDALCKHGIIPIIPDNDGQILVSKAIEQVKQNDIAQSTRKKLLNLVKNANVDTVILACTELSVILNISIKNIQIIDSNRALAQHCIHIACGSGNYVL